jgi:uncharacterized repeat protein (TIGR01451 family)
VALTVSKHIVSGTDLIGGVHYATGGDIITYKIDLTAENSSSSALVHNGVIVDNLPPELEYISASSVDGMMGVYGPELHTVTWLYPSLILNETLTVVLEARVKLDGGPGTITNEVIVLGSGAHEIIAHVDAYFDKTNLLASIKDQNMPTVTLRITGRLWDGDLFFGETTVPVAGNLLLQE